MPIRKTHRFRRLIGAISLLAGFVGMCVWLVNRPETLQHALALANARGDFRIEASSLRWRPVKSAITLKDISITQPATGKALSVKEVDLGYRLLGLFRGKFVIDELKLDDVRVSLPPSDKPKVKKERRRLRTAQLLLLKQIELVDCVASGVTVSFGESSSLVIDELRLALVPSILGDARLAVRADGLKLAKNAKDILTAGFISLKAQTILERWRDTFPYADHFSGQLGVGDISFEGTKADEIDAEMSFEDGRLTLEEFAVLIDGRELSGKLIADTGDESFELDIDIPKPLSLPHLGKESIVMDTGGALSGSISLKGTGFLPRSSRGSGRARITHRFDASREYPVTVAAGVSWNGGAISVSDGRASVDGSEVAFSGNIDISGKSMDLKASGERFPIEHLFTKFQNPHLKKIFGATDFSGTVAGWGKQVDVQVEGTTYDGGWQPIVAERVETKLSVTYDELVMLSTVYAQGVEVGRSDLKVAFGARMADGRRRKDIDLDARIVNMPLDRPMEAFSLKGIGNGSIRLRGPHTSFEGSAKATVKDGSWHAFPFKHASCDIDIERHKLSFTDIELGLAHSPISELAGELTADLTPGRMHLHGEPLDGLSLDATYLYAPARWTFHDITWVDAGDEDGGKLEAKGTLTSKGPMAITVDGTANATTLSLLTPSLYRGRGNVDVDLRIGGTSGDPKLYGDIKFNDNGILLRNPRVDLERLNGALSFDGSRVRFDDVTAKMDDGSMRLSGYFDHRNSKPTYADLELVAKGMVWRTEDNSLMLEFEGDLSLEGRFPSPLLSGNMLILDGMYTKDFTLLDALSGSVKEREKEPEATRPDYNPRYKLSIRNTGDMEIRNNVGDIWLNVNIDVSGTRAKPVVAGSINTTGGEVHYLGLNFDITKGFLEFQGDVDNPYLEVYAEQEISIYNVNLVLHGPIDNLALDLSATSPTGPLEKRDVVSLILFGMTEQERIALQKEGFSSAMIAQSISSVIERPISKFTRLDVFRVEASDTESQSISRLNVGKRMTDRLTVQFATDIGVDNAVQTFAAEYQITDNLLIKGSHSTNSEYELSGFLRFRLR